MQEQAEEPDREAPYLLYDAVKQTLGGLAATPRADATPTGVGAFDVTVGGFVTGEVMAISGPRASGAPGLPLGWTTECRGALFPGKPGFKCDGACG